MSDDKTPRRGSFSLPTRQYGVAAVEFALLAIIFFTIVFGILEVARIVYVFNTLQEVTRRAAAAAANSNFNQSALNTVREQALFRDSSGNLALANFVTPEHVKVEYLSVSRDATTGALSTQVVSSLPSCPGTNYLNCLTDPYSSSCIRMVRVRICQPGGASACDAVPYRAMFPFVDFSVVKLPRSTTTTPAQTLGHKFGVLPCA